VDHLRYLRYTLLPPPQILGVVLGGAQVHLKQQMLDECWYWWGALGGRGAGRTGDTVAGPLSGGAQPGMLCRCCCDIRRQCRTANAGDLEMGVRVHAHVVMTCTQ
jgi:hypothetical protein